MSIFSLMDAQLAWGDAALLDHAAMSLEAGERVGLIGRNGTGKSSLLQVIAKKEKLDAGELRMQDGLRAVYVEQEPALPAAPTFRESLIARGDWTRLPTTGKSGPRTRGLMSILKSSRFPATPIPKRPPVAKKSARL